LVVLHRAEDLGAEQAVALRLEGTVVDGFRLVHFTEGPGTDHLRRSQTDTDRIELFLTLVFQQIQQVFQGLSSSRTCGSRAEPAPHGGACYSVSSSMSMPRERISLISTLKDSGMPASMRRSPSTLVLYILVRPFTSSGLTVSISCRVEAAPWASSAQASLSPDWR